METMYKRALFLCKKLVLFLSVGLVYGFFSIQIGFPLLPCPFYTFTGFYCPSCGVSRMCIALLHLDFKGAFFYNRAIFLLSPILFLLLLQLCIQYIKTGNTTLSKKQKIVVYGMIFFLILFGILRNIPIFSILQPTSVS